MLSINALLCQTSAGLSLGVVGIEGVHVLATLLVVMNVLLVGHDTNLAGTKVPAVAGELLVGHDAHLVGPEAQAAVVELVGGHFHETLLSAEHRKSRCPARQNVPRSQPDARVIGCATPHSCDWRQCPLSLCGRARRCKTRHPAVGGSQLQTLVAARAQAGRLNLASAIVLPPLNDEHGAR